MTTDNDFTPYKNDLDFTGWKAKIEEREALTVAELFAPLRNPDFRPGVYDPGNNDYYRADAGTADLMKLAEIRKWMLYEAIWVADNQDNAQFFEEAFSLYGPLITAALQEMDLRSW